MESIGANSIRHMHVRTLHFLTSIVGLRELDYVFTCTSHRPIEKPAVAVAAAAAVFPPDRPGASSRGGSGGGGGVGGVVESTIDDKAVVRRPSSRCFSCRFSSFAASPRLSAAASSSRSPRITIISRTLASAVDTSRESAARSLSAPEALLAACRFLFGNNKGALRLSTRRRNKKVPSAVYVTLRDAKRCSVGCQECANPALQETSISPHTPTAAPSRKLIC